jgi:hypothetical protein
VVRDFQREVQKAARSPRPFRRLQGFRRRACNGARSNNASGLAALQDSRNATRRSRDLLNGNNISVSDIVRSENNQDGSLIVHTSSDD